MNDKKMNDLLKNGFSKIDAPEEDSTLAAVQYKMKNRQSAISKAAGLVGNAFVLVLGLGVFVAVGLFLVAQRDGQLGAVPAAEGNGNEVRSPITAIVSDSDYFTFHITESKVLPPFPCECAINAQYSEFSFRLSFADGYNVIHGFRGQNSALFPYEQPPQINMYCENITAYMNLPKHAAFVNSMYHAAEQFLYWTNAEDAPWRWAFPGENYVYSTSNAPPEHCPCETDIPLLTQVHRGNGYNIVALHLPDRNTREMQTGETFSTTLVNTHCPHRTAAQRALDYEQAEGVLRMWGVEDIPWRWAHRGEFLRCIGYGPHGAYPYPLTENPLSITIVEYGFDAPFTVIDYGFYSTQEHPPCTCDITENHLNFYFRGYTGAHYNVIQVFRSYRAENEEDSVLIEVNMNCPNQNKAAWVIIMLYNAAENIIFHDYIYPPEATENPWRWAFYGEQPNMRLSTTTTMDLFPNPEAGLVNNNNTGGN